VQFEAAGAEQQRSHVRHSLELRRVLRPHADVDDLRRRSGGARCTVIAAIAAAAKQRLGLGVPVRHRPIQRCAPLLVRASRLYSLAREQPPDHVHVPAARGVMQRGHALRVRAVHIERRRREQQQLDAPRVPVHGGTHQRR